MTASEARKKIDAALEVIADAVEAFEDVEAGLEDNELNLRSFPKAQAVELDRARQTLFDLRGYGR